MRFSARVWALVERLEPIEFGGGRSIQTRGAAYRNILGRDGDGNIDFRAAAPGSTSSSWSIRSSIRPSRVARVS
jgi:hypothetical protein